MPLWQMNSSSYSGSLAKRPTIRVSALVSSPPLPATFLPTAQICIQMNFGLIRLTYPKTLQSVPRRFHSTMFQKRLRRHCSGELSSPCFTYSHDLNVSFEIYKRDFRVFTAFYNAHICVVCWLKFQGHNRKCGECAFIHCIDDNWATKPYEHEWRE